MKKLLALFVMIGAFTSVAHAADVDKNDVIRQFLAPCSLAGVKPESALQAILTETSDNIKLGFKLISLTKVDGSQVAANSCVYTFVRQ
jgi:methionine-rich copper-binding protein CopC